MPSVVSLNSKAATIAPKSCAIQYKIARRKETLPPTRAPKVTAGLTCPPDTFKLAATAANNPNACAKAIIIKDEAPAGASTPYNFPTFLGSNSKT